MENSNSLQKKSRILCPECSNYIDGKLLESGAISGQCKVCKSIIVSKQCSPKEKRIKIIKAST